LPDPFDRFTEVLYELASAQAQATEKLGALADAQRQNTLQFTRHLASHEKLLRELVKAQTSTFQAVTATGKQVSALATSLGYPLENAALKALPALIQRDLNITVHGRLQGRKWVTNKEGKSIEVDIFGKGSKDGQDVVIIGESKSQLSVPDVRTFEGTRIRGFVGVFKEEIVPVLATHRITSARVAQLAENWGIAIFYSYDF
jgi:hypothetical protein